ncbi:MAG: hypothetical protein KJ737_03825 [Proteobacteria bacterium]|nr:hypothetical protein [Pseudomonadota bacterium]
MRSETMTSKERLECAVNLEKPDRVPISPLMNTSAAAKLVGKKYWEIADKGYYAHIETEIELFEKFGGWDGVALPLSPDIYRLGGLKVTTPTEQSPEIQILEEEFAKPEDYEIIAEKGMNDFIVNHLIERVYGKEFLGQLGHIYQDASRSSKKGKDEYTKRGAYFTFPTLLTHPFFKLSLTRSMVKFTEDLYYRPEMVENAIQTMTDELIAMGKMLYKKDNFLTMGLVEERAGGFFYPMRIFERFWWPFTKQIAEAFWADGIKIWFHLDTNWDKNIKYFKELPRGSAIIDLDGTTNIFAAKEQLRDHLCISSDIHPALMSLGKPEEMEAYCKRLIDEIGDDGGLILCTGCCLPVATKAENFRAMLNTGKTYQLSKPA